MKARSEKMKQTRGDIMEGKMVEDTTTYPETAMLKKRLEWFQDMKLGVIFHWGLYSEAGIVESWQLSEEDEWAREGRSWRESITELQHDYWNLIDTFNPVNYDPEMWAEICRKAGIKYGMLTTKHHDGVNLFNTEETGFKVGGKLSPCKRDLAKEFFEAFRQKDLAVGAYYSKADWYSTYYWVDDNQKKGRTASYDPSAYPERWQKYVTFIHRQIHELTHQYGPIDLLWLDAGWCGEGKEDLEMDRLAEIAREKNPELIMVDRMMGGRHENYVTPERKVPDEKDIPIKPWESNIPLGNDWGYVPTDTFKTSQEIIKTFLEVISKGGNLILGVGPKPDGTFTEEETQILSDLGDFTSRFGEGIYQTRALAQRPANNDWYVTCKAHSYYCFTSSVYLQNHHTVYLNEMGIHDFAFSSCVDMASQTELLLHSEGNRVCVTLPEQAEMTHGYWGFKLVKQN